MSAAPGRAKVIATLSEQLPSIATEAVDQLRDRFDEYRHRAADELLPGVTEDLERALSALSEHRAASARELEEAARIGADRAAQQIPAEVMLQGFQVVRRVVWQRARTIAAAEKLSASVVVEIAEDIWAWLDDVVAAAAGAHRQYELDAARTDQVQRMLFVRGLVHATISALEIRTRCAAWGLDADADYSVFRAHPRGRISVRSFEGQLDRAYRGAPFLLARLDEDLVGIVPNLPRLGSGTQVVVGVGPARSLTHASDSYALASRALVACLALGEVGVHTNESLGLRAAVVTEADIGDDLTERLLTPVTSQGPEWEHTLRQYLLHDLAVRPTAVAMGLHPNTIRYRIRRYQELTGSDLSRVEDVVRLWWALQRQAVRNAVSASEGAWVD